MLQARLRDLAAGFRQQMFFWGKDVVHPAGNLLLAHGFAKRPSSGLQGTSCYARSWQNGAIELHGSQAGWFGPGGGFVFIRPLGRCYRWRGEAPPVPGDWPRDLLDPSGPAALHAAALPFLDWWLAYESEVLAAHGPAYRNACFRHLKKLPKSRPWLPPATAARWIHGLRHSPATLPRARRFPESVTP